MKPMFAEGIALDLDFNAINGINKYCKEGNGTKVYGKTKGHW